MSANPLTPERLAALRALCRAATQGENYDPDDTVCVQCGETYGLSDGCSVPTPLCNSCAQNFIAAFNPTTCEALLDAADDLARVREALKRVHREGCTSAGCDTIGPPERHEHSLCCPVGIARHVDAALVGGKGA